jgi:hypothetical protein
MRTAAQVARYTQLIRKPVPAGLWAALRDEGLLRADTPVADNVDDPWEQAGGRSDPDRHGISLLPSN